MTLYHRLIARLRAAVETLTYLLRTDFANATPQTLTDGQVLDTAGEGMVDGSLTVVDTSTGVVEIVGGVCNLFGSSGWGTTGLMKTTALTPSPGQVFCLDFALNVHATTSAASLVLSNATSFSNPPTEWVRRFGIADANVLRVYELGLGIDFAAISDSTLYKYRIILGGFNASGEATADGTYGAAYLIKGGEYLNWTLIWVSTKYNNNIPLYPVVTTYSESSNIHSFLIPETLYPELLTPLVSDTFTDTDGTLLTDHTPDVGGSWILSPGAGSYDIQSNQATCTSHASLFTTVTTEAGASDLICSFTHPLANTLNKNVGLIFRYVDDDNFWFLWVVTGSSGTMRLYEVTSGSLIQRGSTEALSMVAGDVFTAIASGTEIAIFRSGANKLSYSSSVHQTGTKVGIYAGATAQSSGASVDNFQVHARTSAIYGNILDNI